MIGIFNLNVTACCKGKRKSTLEILQERGWFIIIGIGDYDAKSRKRREVCTREGQRIYRGKKYALEKDTGYYVCTSVNERGVRERLHVAMWRAEKLGGREIPPGYVVHHKDWNKNNNIIENLIMITTEEHNLIHNRGDESKLSDREKKIVEELKKLGLI